MLAAGILIVSPVGAILVRTLPTVVEPDIINSSGGLQNLLQASCAAQPSETANRRSSIFDVVPGDDAAIAVSDRCGHAFCEDVVPGLGSAEARQAAEASSAGGNQQPARTSGSNLRIPAGARRFNCRSRSNLWSRPDSVGNRCKDVNPCQITANGV